jgi:cytochrome c-type biogenesis protein CcmH/NrfG
MHTTQCVGRSLAAVVAVVVVVTPGSIAAQAPEATSLLRKPLVSAPPTGETTTRLDADLAKAQADSDRDPSSGDAAIWLGRRLAYLGRFRDAIDAYTRGIRTSRGCTAIGVIATSRSASSISPSPI